MVKPPSNIDPSSSSYNSIEHSGSTEFSSTDLKVSSARDSVEFVPPAHSSKRLYVWSTVARHMPHSVAKLLSRIILNSTIVSQHQVGVVAHMLSSSYMSSVRTEQFKSMTPLQISKLDNKQMAAIQRDDYAVLKDTIGEMDPFEFANLCNDAKNPRILFKLRLDSLKEAIRNIPDQEYFVPTAANFKGDMTRSELKIGDQVFPVVKKSDYENKGSTKEAEEDLRFERIGEAFTNLLGEASVLLPSFANQGAFAFAQTIIASSFPPPCVCGSTIQRFECQVVNGLVKIQIATKGTIATEKETDERFPQEPREEVSLPYLGAVFLSIPLEDFQKGDFSNATGESRVY